MITNELQMKRAQLTNTTRTSWGDYLYHDLNIEFSISQAAVQYTSRSSEGGSVTLAKFDKMNPQRRNVDMFLPQLHNNYVMQLHLMDNLEEDGEEEKTEKYFFTGIFVLTLHLSNCNLNSNVCARFSSCMVCTRLSHVISAEHANMVLTCA